MDNLKNKLESHFYCTRAHAHVVFIQPASCPEIELFPGVGFRCVMDAPALYKKQNAIRNTTTRDPAMTLMKTCVQVMHLFGTRREEKKNVSA